MQRRRLFFQPDGKIQFVHDDTAFLLLKAQGEATIKRASTLEPTPEGLWRFDLNPIGQKFSTGVKITRAEALNEEQRLIEDLLHRNELK